MKKIIITAILALLFPVIVRASVLEGPNLILTANVKTDCQNDAALACFNPNNQTIYLSKNLNSGTLKFALTHEYGHFLMQNVELEEYQEVFGKGNMHDLQEKAANSFYDFVWLRFMLSERTKAFFKKII